MGRSQRVECLIGRYKPKYVAYNPEIAKVLGDVLCGLFVSQLLWWDEKGSDPEWVYKTQKEMYQETGLSRRNQETARKRLIELGVLSEKLKGVPAKLHYRIDLERLSDLIEIYLATNSDCTDRTNQFGVTVQTRMSETGNLLHENTTESTQRTSLSEIAAPQTLAACAPLNGGTATTKTVRAKDNFELNPNGDKWQNAATRCLLYFYQLTNRAITNDKAKQKRYFQIVTKWWADAKGKDISDTENRLRTILEQVIRDTNKAQKSKDKTERLTLVDPQSYDKYVTGALSEMRGREQYHGG